MRTLLRLLTFASVAFAVSARAAVAQSAPELVAKNLAARGGPEKLAAIATIRFTGKIVYPGDFELTYQETRARRDGEVRYDSSLQGLTLVQGYDGHVGWRINPFQGRRDAERMSEDETRALADDATIDGRLLGAKARGDTVTYLGREDFEGTNTYKLRVSDRSGTEYVYYLDPDTDLEIKVVETRTLRGARQVTATEYGDYELVDGVYFPFTIDSGPVNANSDQLQRLTIESASANFPFDSALFALPAAPSAK